MATPPLVTVLIPTYARAHFLPEALESVLRQTHTHLEVLIFDDASPDHTPVVARKFVERDSRVRYIRHAKNLGITGNWRHALAEAKGEFVCFLEDDDRFEPDFIARMIAPLQADPELIFSFCNHWVINEAGERDPVASETITRRFKRDALMPGIVPDLRKTAIVDLSISITATMFRNAYLSTSFIDDRAKGGIDISLLYQCAKTGRHAFYLADHLMEYRTHEGGVSRSMPQLMAEGHLFVYGEALRDVNNTHLYPALRERFARAATSCGICYLSAGAKAKARRPILRALRSKPSVHSLGALLASYVPLPSVIPTVRKAKQIFSKS